MPIELPAIDPTMFWRALGMRVVGGSAVALVTIKADSRRAKSFSLS